MEKLDEGGYVLDCNDGSQSLGIVCADETTKTIWEADLADWISYSIDCDRRAKRDEVSTRREKSCFVQTIIYLG